MKIRDQFKEEKRERSVVEVPIYTCEIVGVVGERETIMITLQRERIEAI